MNQKPSLSFLGCQIQQFGLVAESRSLPTAAASKDGSEPSAFRLVAANSIASMAGGIRAASGWSRAYIQQRVEPVGEVSGFLGPQAGKDPMARGPQKHGAAVGKLVVLEFCISAFQVTPGSFSTSAMPSTLMNSVTMSFLMAGS
ncbi:hypothetical protein NKI82_17925 [Mesorhizobium sp. M0482]|uniref:hypothetical protein n=1 Tax=Mesorhizobium sp. M0482 TaxID=2956948 RepID=UPI00333ADE5D